MPLSSERIDMVGAVYILCALLSLACSFMLFRGYKQTGFRLLFWSCFGFLGFALNNVMLFLDVFVISSVSLSTWRTLPALVGMTIMVYGLISETN